MRSIKGKFAHTQHQLIAGVIGMACLGIGLTTWQFVRVEHAHSSFANYYAFRGCVRLVSKSDATAVCALPSGKTIKLVKYKNKWYLQGDLPVC